MNSENSSVESSIKQTLQSANESFTQCLGDLEEKVRSSPIAAVSLGVSVGYLMRFFPLGFFVAVIMRILLFSIKPLILIFGAYKLYEIVRENYGDNWPTSESDREREPLLDSPSGPPAA
ncbi:MAG TPA: hypothetical protein VIS99_01480 [Terrimicrobiaceae bacterium]